jgi:hypothetical protein
MTADGAEMTGGGIWGGGGIWKYEGLGEGENIWGTDLDSLFVINAVLTALEFKGRGTDYAFSFATVILNSSQFSYLNLFSCAIVIAYSVFSSDLL